MATMNQIQRALCRAIDCDDESISERARALSKALDSGERVTRADLAIVLSAALLDPGCECTTAAEILQ